MTRTGQNAVPRFDHRAKDAAEAIVRLINARPRCPRAEEIAAIIEDVALSKRAQSSAPSELMDEYGPDLTSRKN